MAFATAKAAFCAAFLSFLEVAYTVNKRMTNPNKRKTWEWQKNDKIIKIRVISVWLTDSSKPTGLSPSTFSNKSCNLHWRQLHSLQQRPFWVPVFSRWFSSLGVHLLAWQENWGSKILLLYVFLSLNTPKHNKKNCIHTVLISST